MLVRTLITAGSVAGLIIAVPPVSATAATDGICYDASMPCRVVARTDVDGDGARDVVAVAAPRGRRWGFLMTRTAGAGDDFGFRVSAPIRPMSAYVGSATVVGNSGRELVLSRTWGAHTTYDQMFRVTANGRIVRLRAPGRRDGLWVTDSAATVYAGYLRRVRPDGRTVVVERTALARSTGTKFGATLRRFVWRGAHRGWHRVSTTKHLISAKRARTFAGYRGAFGGPR